MPRHRRRISLPTPGPADLAWRWHEAPLASIRPGMLTVLTATALSIGVAYAQDGGKERDTAGAAPSGEAALLKKLGQMEQRIRALESQLKQKDDRAIERAHGQAAASTTSPTSVKPAKDRKDAEDADQPKEKKGPVGADRKSVV